MKKLIEKFYSKNKRFIKFSLSSFTAFLIDYAIFSLIMAIGSERVTFFSLTFANIFARVISSSVNFTINRKLVFKSCVSLKKSAVEFFSLAAFILLCNSLVLNFITHILSVNHYIAKILTEMTFFLFNFSVQSLVIFRNKKR